MIFQKLLRNSLIIAVILLISQVSLCQNETGSGYESIIKQADQYFKQGDYIKAKTSYQYASRLRPSEQYPKDKLSETVEKLRERMAIMDQYTTVISKADDFFRNGDYDNARTKYQEAAKILPSETYPAEKINEIEEKEAEARKQQVAYDDAVYRAEKYVKYRKYDEAIGEYEKAAEIFPLEQIPKDKIAELKAKKAEVEKAKNEYNQIIADADRLFNLKYYENAKDEYQKASEARPDEDYPQAKINEIDKLLVKKADYDKLVDQADQLYMNKSLDAAKSKYQAALKIYPSESYPKDMIGKINTALEEKMGADELYKKSIKDADAFLAAKDYTNALNEFQNAANLKPSESYPKSKIQEIQGIIDQKQSAAEAYNLAVKKGDAFLDAQDYQNAKTEFEKALQLKPGESYPTEKLAVANNALKGQEAALKNYNQAIAKGDDWLETKDFDKALDEYNNALLIIPGDQDAQAKIDNAEKLKKASLDKDSQYTQLITEADKLFEDKSYSSARSKYADAQALKPAETYPTEMMKKIDDKFSDQKEINNSYNKSIAAAEIYYNKEEYNEALDEYKKAAKLKPNEKLPAQKIAELNVLLGKGDESEKEYLQTIAEADEQYSMQQYEDAKKSYMKASFMKPKEQYPKSKIEELDNILGENASKEADYNRLVSAADRMLESGDYEKARKNYNQALEIKPKDEYLLKKLNEVDDKIALDDKARQEAYDNVVAEADKAFAAKDYNSARIKYQNALKYKPDEAYPNQKLDEISHLTDDLDKKNDQYTRLIADADRLFTSGEFQEAKAKYVEASSIFPEKVHPKERLEEINMAYRSENTKSQQDYDKAIADADKFMAAAVYDQALASYRKAQNLMPDETYPAEMIGRINKILNDNAMRHIVTSPVEVENNEEKVFNFEPLQVTDRKSSVLVIRVKNTAEKDCKVFLNYGKGSSKNGGFILPLPVGDEPQEFTIPLGKQLNWSDKDNNYVSLTPQGGKVVITGIEINKGEE